MHRRNLFKKLGVVALYGSFPSVLSEFLSSCNNSDRIQRAGFFSNDEFQLLNQLIDIILPRTTTPGGIDVRAPYFVDLVVRDCMNATDQQTIKKGLHYFKDADGKKFLSLNADEQKRIVSDLDKKAFDDENSNLWYRILKKLTIIGYFTSREGMSTALNYVQVPGDYKASIPYKKGDKAMAKTFLMYW
jgi:hypothetical protein